MIRTPKFLIPYVDKAIYTKRKISHSINIQLRRWRFNPHKLERVLVKVENYEHCFLCKLEFIPKYLIRNTWCRCPRCGLIWIIKNKKRLVNYENDYYFYDENLDEVNIARSIQFIRFVKKK